MGALSTPRAISRSVIASWSGGIDSTGTIANLLAHGYHVTAITLEVYGGGFASREAKARAALLPHLLRIAERSGGGLQWMTRDAAFLWAFSPDGVEIPRRNKHIIDHLVTAWAMPRGVKNVAMGEYIGADTWLVKDHVGMVDADARSLAAYVFTEYGLDWRLLTLADFGESRYKSDRLRLGFNVLGAAIGLTTNCLVDSAQDCGACYKCIERSAAFFVADLPDATMYQVVPRLAAPERWHQYVAQMEGQKVSAHFADFTTPAAMPTRARP